MSQSVRIGVVGLGRMGATYCQIVANMRNVVLSGVCDVDLERATEVAGRFGTSAYSTTEELLDAGVDGIIIATSDNAHMEPTVAALERGVDVFLEKPLATSIEDATKIVDAADASSAQLLVGHVCRFDPAYVAVRDAVAQRKFGQIRYVHARRISTPGTLSRMGGRVSCVAYLGIHDIDLLHWMFDVQVRNVSAKAVRGILGGVETELVISSTLEFDDGSIAVLENSWLRPDGPTTDKTASMLVAGENGMAEITPFVSGSVMISDSGVALQNQVYLDVSTPSGASGGLYAEEVDHFLAVIARDAQLRCTAREALRAVEVVAGIEESLASGSKVEIRPAMTGRHE